MAKYVLPINMDDVKDDNDIIIDMSKTNFPIDKDKQKISCFLFIRNTGLTAKYDFSDCDYKDKEEFLIQFMFHRNINVGIKELLDTWVCILTTGYTNIRHLSSILNEDEINLFIKNNIEYVHELYRFFVSIPLCSMSFYLKSAKMDSAISMGDFQSSDYYGFNVYSLNQLFNYNEIILLTQMIDNIAPVYYYKYFDIDDNRSSLRDTLFNKFPYLNMMNLIMPGNNENIDAFKNELENLLNKMMEEK